MWIPSIASLVFLGALLSPLAILGCLLAINSGYSGTGLDFSSMKWTGLFWLSTAGLVVYALFVGFAALRSDNRRSQVWLPMLGSLIVVCFLFGVMEVATRVLVKNGSLGFELGSLTIKPYEWSAAQRHNLELYRNSLEADAFYVGHPRWGWAAGSARESADGLYQSSIEGLRSAEVGEDLRSVPHESRIALYGDSFVFSEEVGYRESLQYFLAQRIDQSTQVLNFGMPGYGIDQAYLSFVDSVGDWKPQFAVLGFIQHDLIRAWDVYTFLRPSWNIPFSKPRFEVDGDGLKLSNVPNISPVEIFGAQDVVTLPFLELDQNFNEFEWQHGWAHKSMVFRVLASAYPRYWPQPADTNERIAELGVAIASAFVDEANKLAVTPLVIYLPSRGDFDGRDTSLKDATISRAVDAGIEIVDLTGCLTQHASPTELFVENGVHYSGPGNQAFADCLLSRLPSDL